MSKLLETKSLGIHLISDPYLFERKKEHVHAFSSFLKQTQHPDLKHQQTRGLFDNGYKLFNAKNINELKPKQAMNTATQCPLSSSLLNISGGSSSNC